MVTLDTFVRYGTGLLGVAGMAQRPIWRGHLRLALVSCPVALYSASHDREAIRFNMINPATNHRVRMITVDGETNEPLQRNQTVKGYEFRKDHYVIMDDADFEAVRVESSTMMTVEKFIPQASLDPIYYDSSYFLGPDGDAGADVFAVLRDAIVASGKIALSHVVISKRERVVAIVPMGRGLVAHTLHEERDLNNAADVFDKIPHTKPDPEMVKLATMLIDRQTGTYDPADMVDRYEARLRAVIDAKIKGEGLEPDSLVEPDMSNVIDLMAALKKSLAGSSNDKAAPASGSPKGARPTSKSGTREGSDASASGTKGTAATKARAPAPAKAAAASPAPKAAAKHAKAEKAEALAEKPTGARKRA